MYDSFAFVRFLLFVRFLFVLVFRVFRFCSFVFTFVSLCFVNILSANRASSRSLPRSSSLPTKWLRSPIDNSRQWSATPAPSPPPPPTVSSTSALFSSHVASSSASQSASCPAHSNRKKFEVIFDWLLQKSVVTVEPRERYLPVF